VVMPAGDAGTGLAWACAACGDRNPKKPTLHVTRTMQKAVVRSRWLCVLMANDIVLGSLN
jgi:hypothetical protein